MTAKAARCEHYSPPQLFNLQTDPGEADDRAADPACQQVLRELLDRALRDWDPERLQQHMVTRRQVELPLLREWLRRMQPPEPDTLWWQEHPPIDNWVDRR